MEEKSTLGPPPPGCHYEQCWCMVWIVPNVLRLRYPSVCRACGVPKKRCDPKKWAWVGITLIEYGGQREQERLSKKNKSKKSDSTTTSGSDDTSSPGDRDGELSLR